MRIGKTIIRILLISFLITVTYGSMVGCNKTENKNEIEQLAKTDNAQQVEKTETTSTKRLRIALIMKTLTNPFFVEMEKGARKAESELNVELVVKTGTKETSIQQQISIVEEMIAEKVDAIVIAPGSSTELIPVLKKAQDAKIPIVNVDNRLDKKISEEMGLVSVPFISVNNELGAYDCVKKLISSINRPTNAVIIEGIPQTENGEQRKAGALRAFSQNKNIKVVASDTANWKIDEANSVMKKMFEKNSNIGVVFCANDMMALGAIQYIQQSNHKSVLVGGFDALTEAKNAIENGSLQVTVDQQADLQGYTGIKYAIQLINNQKVQEETILESKIVDKTTLQ